MAAFIVVDINSPRSNTFVFNASIPTTGASPARFNFLRKFLETFSTYRWSDICMFWKCGFDLPNWISSPRSSFLAWAEFEDSSLRSIFLVLEDWVSSSCLSWENFVGFGLMFCVSFPSRDETQRWSNSWFPGLSGSLESCGGSSFALRRFLTLNSVVSVTALPTPLSEHFLELSWTWHFAFCLKENGCKKTSRNSWYSTNEDDSSRHVWNFL